MSIRIKETKGGVTAARGFEAAGVEAGIKYKDRTDMAVVYSQVPCIGAGTFTTNVVKAAPVLWDRELVEHAPFLQAVIVNSGIANACTGEQGRNYCKRTAGKAAECLHIPENSVLVASTGVIGMQLPIEKIEKGVELLAASKEAGIDAGTRAAEAIMTTDTVSKQAAVTFEMLGFVTTDLAISKELLTKALKEDVQDTFNMISVDGDTSTNDTLLLLANGMAGNPEITEENEDYETFKEALRYINTILAKKMAGDGEGATALFEVKVIHAATKQDARILSKSVITSSLTKAAIFGHDANWILCALGYSGVQFDPEKLELSLLSSAGEILIYKDGTAAPYSEEEASRILSQPEVTALVDMKSGEESAAAWGCDLTYDYVKINADYRS